MDFHLKAAAHSRDSALTLEKSTFLYAGVKIVHSRRPETTCHGFGQVRCAAVFAVGRPVHTKQGPAVR